MKARLMLAAISWNDLQRKRGPKKYVVRWSKRRAAYVLERRQKAERPNVAPSHVKKLMCKATTASRQHLAPIVPPVNLKRRGGDVPKPTKEELLAAKYRFA
jgi:hypothetical protein